MDFLHTNNSPNKKWANRILTSNWTQADVYGVSWELIIDLVNRLNVSPWINIPEMADDEYIVNLAKLWNANYKIDKTIYIEYSNECWNTIFSCHNYCVEQGKLANMSNYQWYGQRVCQISQLFADNFDNSDLLYTVMGTQEVNPWITEQVLLGDNYKCADGVALAAYYCTYNLTDQQIVSMTYDELFDNIESPETQQHYATYIRNQVNTAKKYTNNKNNELQVIAYEGSWGCTPHYGSYYNQETYIYNNMTIMSRISKSITMNLGNFHNETDGSLFNLFSYIGFGGQYGNWGHLGYDDSFNKENTEPYAYKFKGIQNYFNP